LGNIINKGKVNLSRKNINKVYDYLQNVPHAIEEEKESDLKIKTPISESFVKLIDEKSSDSNYMSGYSLVSCFPNVNFITDDDNLKGVHMPTLEESIGNEDINLDKEYGILNMVEYKIGFEKILEGLEEGKIYKIIFRWKSVGSNYLGYNSVEYNTSPSFFIYKNIDIDVLLYKFMSFLNLFESKYGFGGAISLDIFVKE